MKTNVQMGVAKILWKVAQSLQNVGHIRWLTKKTLGCGAAKTVIFELFSMRIRLL